MRDPARIEAVLLALEVYWQQNPDLRLGQIVSNMANRISDRLDPFYMEDDEFVFALRRDRP